MKLKRVIVKDEKQLVDINKVFPIKDPVEYITWEQLFKWGKRYKGQLITWFYKDEIVAIMFVNFWKKLMYISNFEVVKSYQHQGVGSKIMKQIKKLFYPKTIILEVIKHTTLKKFYKHFNIVPLHQKGIYYGKNLEFLTNNPYLDYWTVNGYFFYEDDCWTKFKHASSDNVPYENSKECNIINFK